MQLDWVDIEIFDMTMSVIGSRRERRPVPGGFGQRGTPGKIEAVRYARENHVPFFGICFGMQMAAIEAARNLAGLRCASSTEFGPCDDPVVGLLTEWVRGNEIERRMEGGDLGGTMRLGSVSGGAQSRLPGIGAIWRREHASRSGTVTATR